MSYVMNGASTSGSLMVSTQAEVGSLPYKYLPKTKSGLSAASLAWVANDAIADCVEAGDLPAAVALAHEEQRLASDDVGVQER
jgi:hypothetical protein